MPQFVKYFLLVLAAAIASAALGGLFAALVAVVSPEFVKELFISQARDLVRYSAAMGMICGLMLGTSVMAFCILVSAISHWFRGGKADASDRELQN